MSQIGKTAKEKVREAARAIQRSNAVQLEEGEREKQIQRNVISKLKQQISRLSPARDKQLH